MLPAQEYAQRLRARESLATRYQELHVRLGNTRLLLAIAAAAIAWWSFARHALSPWWLALPVVAFVILATYHSRVLRRRTCAERAIAVYRNGLARIEDRWTGTGQSGDRFNDPHHIYAADLDLFGKGGLFELLSTARTRMGEETLARWLMGPSDVTAVGERHAAVAELGARLDLREDIAVLGEDAGVGVYPEALTRWAEAPAAFTQTWMRLVAALLAIAFAGAAVIWGSWGSPLPLLGVVLIEAGMAFRLRKALDAILHETEHAFADLGLLASVLARIERERFTAPRLRALQEQLSSHHMTGSRAIARLNTIVYLIESRHNLFFRVLDLPLMYSIQVAFAAENWRREHGAAVRNWIAAIGEVEAIIALATYSYEHPDDPFPEFATGAACFESEELGHPLIPAARCVRNSLCLCGETRLLLVSGSNMSGKSTLLRAIGINTVLAMAGAPVRARRLRLTPLQVGASIRINDSLQEGSSRFYAEITRLRRIFDLAGGAPPLLFLLDELLQGTNSHDRRIGAEGIVRALLQRGAIGLVSTHDLALTDIGGPLDGHIKNVHFQDELDNGTIRFDYKLRDGVVTKSNGLELMRSIGLEV